MTEAKITCGNCGGAHAERDTTLVTGKAGGNFKRASRNTMRRVCRECTEMNVALARQGGYRLPSTGQINWQQAADQLEVK